MRIVLRQTMIAASLVAVGCSGAASPPPSPPSPAPPSPSANHKPGHRATAASGDAAAFVDAHNQVRARHCAPPVAWSTKLAAVAQRWADHLRDGGCLFEHSRTDYGENLAAGTDGALDPSSVVGMWYAEISKYDFKRGGFSMDTGHFTQVVWRATSKIGCGSSRCNGMTIWVCNYDSPGNVEGEYRENVQASGCR